LIGLLLALVGLGLGLAVMAVVWVVVHRGFGARRLMVSDLDVYRSAKLLIDQHDDEAPIHAAMRADEFLDKGDLDGAAVWRRIVGAINELLNTRRGDGAPLH